MNEALQPAAPNALICPCCQQTVEGREFLADPSTSTITNGAITVRFTPRGFGVAKHLIDAFPRMAMKDAIYDAIFCDAVGDGPDTKIIDVYICKIRPAMAELGLVIETVWGKGWRLVEADATQANAIRDAGIHSLRGRVQRWTPEDDKILLDLISRKMKPAQCATIMRKPYMSVERRYKRLAASVRVGGEVA